MIKPMPAEWLHEKRCLAEAMISAIQNARDTEDEFFTAHDFRTWAQENAVLQQADEYLNTGLQDCRCDKSHVFVCSECGQWKSLEESTVVVVDEQELRICVDCDTDPEYT